MALSNTAVPKYYGMFRDAVIRREIPVCETVSLEMHRIDQLIDNPRYWYDDRAVEGFIHYCENELTLTDGSDLHLLDSFKLWAEQIFGWYQFIERSVFVPSETGSGGHYEMRRIKKRLITKQYLIVARGAAKSMYASCFVERWERENGPFGIEKVIQGAKTESVPLGELKKLSEERMLIFDEALMSFTMGNCIAIEDTNGNRKLLKRRHEAKIDAVAAMMDAFVAFKLNREAFE